MKYDFKHLKAIGYDPYQDADDFYYDSKDAEIAIDFFKNELTLTKGKWKGQPFIPFGWAQDIIRCIFGWKRNDTCLRRYRKGLIYVPRKAAKSELCAGIADCELFTGDEPDNEIYIGARDRGQALTLYAMAEKMTQQNPELKKEVEPHKTTKEIRALWDGSKIQAVSSDAMSLHSLSPGMAIIDELHAQRNGDLIEALTTGMGARQQPLVLYITTADIDRTSICNDELGYAKSIRDNPKVNLNYLPVIYETSPDDDWTDEEVWAKVNPSYPVTPSPQFLRDEIAEAKKSLRKELSFKRLYLNMKTSSLDGWINMDFWRLGSEKFEEDELIGQDCYLSFDLASKIDLCAVALFFPATMRLVCRFYCPKKAVENDKSGHYKEWVEDGELTICGDTMTDYRYIKKDILAFREKFNIKKLPFDPHNANQMVAELAEEGLEEILEEFTQSFKNYTEPAKEFEALILSKLLKHNSRVLDWMAANVTVREGPSADLMPQKTKKDSPLKIDGIVASIMCIGAWLTEKKEEEYDGEGVYHLEDYLEE